MPGFTRRQMLLGAGFAAAAPMLALAPSRAARALAAPPPPLVPAIAARSVFDSYGINTHFSFLSAGSVWANTDAAAQLVLDLQVGAVRQSIPRTPWGRDAVKQAMTRLTAAGLRWTCPVIGLEDSTSLGAAQACVNEQLDWLQANTDLSLLDSLPGINEPNGSGLKDWAQRTRWAQQALWEETRSRSNFNAVKIQGAPLWMKGGPNALGPDVNAVGDMSRWMDRGDVHLYPADEDPEYQVDERLAVLAPMHPGKPICVSEGGYTTAIGRGYTGGAWLVPQDTAGLYAPKHVMVHAVDGRRFFAYELLDEAPPYPDQNAIREGGFGLVTTPSLFPSSWRRKLAFESTRRLLTLLRDPQVQKPASLRVEVVTTGATSANLRTALLHRSDGKHLLVMWQAADLYEWNRQTLSGQYLRVLPLTVTVTLDHATAVAVFEPSTRDTPVNSFTAQTFSQSLGTGLQVLQIG